MAEELIYRKIRGLNSSSPEHARMVKRARVCRDANLSPEEVRLAGKKFLPKLGEESDESWKSRRDRVHFEDAYARTIDELANRPFTDDMLFSAGIPGLGGEKSMVRVGGREVDLSRLRRNADGMGTSLQMLAKDWFRDGLNVGIMHCLVDLADGAAGDRKRVTLNLHPMENVFKWDHNVDDDGNKTLSRVHIRTLHSPSPTLGSFESSSRLRVKVLYAPSAEARLVHGEKFGEFAWVEVYEAKKFDETSVDSDELEWAMIDRHTLEPVRRVPLATFQVFSERIMESRPPLENHAWLNLRQYQSESLQNVALDFERFSILFGRDLDLPRDGSGNTKFTIGPSKLVEGRGQYAALNRVEGGGGGIKAGERDLARREQKMISLSNEPLVSVPKKTATGEMRSSIKETSSLKTWATVNFAQAMEEALTLAMEWEGIDNIEDKDVEITIQGDFKVHTGDRERLDYAKFLRGRGDITQKTALEIGRRSGVFWAEFSSDEEITDTKEEAASVMSGIMDGILPGDDDDDDGQEEQEGSEG